MMHLETITVYPVKGVGGVSLQEASVRARGLAQDRRWMLVDMDGRALSQRQLPKLVWISASIEDKGLSLQFPGIRDLHFDFPGPSASRLDVNIWGDSVSAQLAATEASDWFTSVLDHDCRLVFMDSVAQRGVDPAYSDGEAVVSFADGYPLLLTSTASLHKLNGRMDCTIPMSRFRPNVVVHGAKPFDEDGWRVIQIGSVRFDVVKSCTRCVVTTVNADTAVPGKEPLRTLSTFRKRDGKVYFGENLIPRSEGTIIVGDLVTVIEKRMPEQRVF